jgi:hypothetical protein
MRSHALILTALLSVACAHAAVPRWVDLTARPTVARRDVQWALASLIAGRAVPADDAAMVQLLRDRKLIRPGELARAEKDATRGYACLLFARALEEDRSTMRFLFRNSERYAYRHLEFLHLIPAGGASHRISGGELVSLLALSRKRLNAEAK